MATRKEVDTKKEALKKEIKERAVKNIAKGKLDQALEDYLQLWKLSPDDFRAKLKIGEILEKLGRVKEAVGVFKKVAEAYAKDGFLIQAISVCKIILEKDPGEVETKNLLAGLYAKRGMGKESTIAAGHPKQAVEKKLANINSDELLDELFAEDLEATASALPAIPLFSELEPNEFSAVIDTLTPWKVPEGTVVCQEGTPAESMFIIAHGSVRVCTQGKKGKMLELAVLKPGEFFGEIGLFTKSARTASCVAKEETELLEIKRSDFERIAAKFPRIKGVLHDFYQIRVLDTILARSELFGLLKVDVRQALAKRFVAKEFGDGEWIVREGEEGDGMYMIRDGSVIVVTHKNNKEIVLATLEPGNFFGEVALLSGKKRTASVRALGNCDVICLNRQDFDWALKASPEFSSVVKAYVEKRVKETIETMTQK